MLPFTNLSGDPDQEYFADGITDDLTTDISLIVGSLVIARNTAFTYKGKAVDARQIGHYLGVRYVVEGSVRRSGDRIWSMYSWWMPKAAPTSGRTGSRPIAKTSRRLRARSPAVSRGR